MADSSHHDTRHTSHAREPNPYGAQVWTTPEGEVHTAATITVAEDEAFYYYSNDLDYETARHLPEVLEAVGATVVVAHSVAFGEQLEVDIVFTSPMWDDLDDEWNEAAGDQLRSLWKPAWCRRVDDLAETLEATSQQPRGASHQLLHASILEVAGIDYPHLHMCPHQGFENLWGRIAELRAELAAFHCDRLEQAPLDGFDEKEAAMRIQMLRRGLAIHEAAEVARLLRQTTQQPDPIES